MALSGEDDRVHGMESSVVVPSADPVDYSTYRLEI
jgi:hypothetical protein